MNCSITSISSQHNFFINQATQTTNICSNEVRKSILFSFNNIEKTISLPDIIRLEAASSYTLFFIRGFEKPVLKSKPLKYYSRQLGTEQFVRVHQSHLINKNFIQHYRLKRKPSVILLDGTTIIISRRKLSLVKQDHLLLL